MDKNQFLSGPGTLHLAVPGGTIAYDIQGAGPLVLLVPGMGDLRASYRFLAPTLVDAGYRVATVDLRGHGDSSASFASYGDVETASDIALLLRDLAVPAVIVGNSMAAGAAAIVAAEHPALVDGLVLVGPFVREPSSTSTLRRLSFRVMMARPWAASVWNAYLPKLYAGREPADFPAYREALVAAIRRPGYTRAFSRTTRTDHVRAGESLPAVQAPTLVIMGDKDPDFADPQAEAEWIADALGGSSVLVPDAGHYPHSQQPDLTSAAIVGFLRTLVNHA